MRLKNVERGLGIGFAFPENLEAQFPEAIIDATERHGTNHVAIDTVNSILSFTY